MTYLCFHFSFLFVLLALLSEPKTHIAKPGTLYIELSRQDAARQRGSHHAHPARVLLLIH